MLGARCSRWGRSIPNWSARCSCGICPPSFEWTSMKVELLYAQLQALQAQCSAAMTLIADYLTGSEGSACDHPEEFRVNTGTLRGPRTFYCRRCKQELEDPAMTPVRGSTP